MRKENYLQKLIYLHDSTKNLLLELTKVIGQFYKANIFKDKINLSVKIKEIESTIFYNVSLFNDIYLKNKDDKNLDKNYIAKLIFNLKEGTIKVNRYKKKVFVAKHKSKFLQKLKKGSTANTTADGNTNDALALI